MKPFNHLTIAGTFDRLHTGHLHLIDKALELGEKVSIGLATKNLYQNKPFADQIQSFDERRKELENYLKDKRWLERSSIFELFDIYGISKTDSTLDSILVTKETKANALKINKYRKAHGLPLLKIITIPFMKGEDRQIISSSRIRWGEIDRKGTSFKKKFKQKVIFSLPDSLRAELREPIGEVFSTTKESLAYLKNKKYPLLITVGDVVTQSLVKEGVVPDISIIDLRTRRRTAEKNELFEHTKIKINKVVNHQGTIYRKAVDVFNKVLATYFSQKKKQIIVVEGEEDLMAIPAIILSPLGTVVLYGLYDRGVVVVVVTEELKSAIAKLLGEFL